MAPNSLTVAFLSKLIYMYPKLGEWCMGIALSRRFSIKVMKHFYPYQIPHERAKKRVTTLFIASWLFCCVAASFSFFLLVFQVISVVWSKSLPCKICVNESHIKYFYSAMIVLL